MGVEVTGWLEGRRARIEGECPAIIAAFGEAGAIFVEEGDIDIWVHVAPPPAI